MEETSARLRGRSYALRPDSLSVNNPTLHHKSYVLDGSNVLERIAGDGNDVGQIAVLERPDLSLPAQQFRSIQQIGLQHGQGRHAIFHHEHESAGLRSARTPTTTAAPRLRSPD